MSGSIFRDTRQALRSGTLPTPEARLDRLALQYSATANIVLAPVKACIDPRLAESLDSATRHVEELYRAISQQLYRDALLSVVQLGTHLQQWHSVAADNTLTCIRPDAVARPSSQFQHAAGNADGRTAANGEATPLPGGLRQAFSAAQAVALAVDLAEARTQHETESALLAYTGASGGARAKRIGEARARVSINAYLGGAVISAPNGRTGVFAPVGVELGCVSLCGRFPTWTRGRPTYVGLLLIPVDLGSVAALRFEGDDNDPANVEFDQIFAPGVAAVVSLGRWPISAGALYQVRPSTTGGGRSGGFGGIVAVDVPLMTLR